MTVVFCCWYFDRGEEIFHSGRKRKKNFCHGDGRTLRFWILCGNFAISAGWTAEVTKDWPKKELRRLGCSVPVGRFRVLAKKSNLLLDRTSSARWSASPPGNKCEIEVRTHEPATYLCCSVLHQVCWLWWERNVRSGSNLLATRIWVWNTKDRTKQFWLNMYNYVVCWPWNENEVVWRGSNLLAKM